MPPTTGYSFDDVVLVPFAFTDQAGIEKRLVLRKLGQLPPADLSTLRKGPDQILG